MQKLTALLKRKTVLSAIGVVCLAPALISWGMFGHERINHAAVLSLPAPVQGFFYNHIDFVTQESTVPDLRKYTLNDTVEYTRHYVDLENYGAPDSLPATLEGMKKKIQLPVPGEERYAALVHERND